MSYFRPILQGLQNVFVYEEWYHTNIADAVIVCPEFLIAIFLLYCHQKTLKKIKIFSPLFEILLTKLTFAGEGVIIIFKEN